MTLRVGTDRKNDYAGDLTRWEENGADLVEVKRRLLEEKPERLLIKGIPNGRLGIEIKYLQSQLSQDRYRTVGELRKELEDRSRGWGIDPDQVRDMAEQIGYSTEICWAAEGKAGWFDALLTRAESKAGQPSLAEITLGSGVSQQEEDCTYANSPSLATYIYRLNQEMRTYLKQKLPSYMVPTAFVAMRQLPLTPNGKLDIRALPPPWQAQLVNPDEEPQSPIEEIVANIWGEVLQLKQVGVNQNFFELGGHSLLATQVISRIREVMKVEVSLKVLFDRPTVARFAEVMSLDHENRKRIDAPPVRKVSRDQKLPLSFSQQRLWFIDQLEPDSLTYNVARAVRLTGLLNIVVLRQSLEEISRRHEALRTRFEIADGFPVQVIDEPREIELDFWDLTNLPEAQRERQAREIAAREAVQRFDLERGPIWRAGIVRLRADDHVLLLNIHHVLSDGWSMGILARELTALYEAYAEGRRAALAELPVQYADFAFWQREWLQGEVLDEQLGYWRRQLAGTPVLELPPDRTQTSCVEASRGARIFFNFTGDDARVKGAQQAGRRYLIYDASERPADSTGPLCRTRRWCYWHSDRQ